MGIVLGPNQYGKAECRLLRVRRDTERHQVKDLNVSTTLRGDFAAAHTAGDQAAVLPTDSQKNTVYAFAQRLGVDQIEDFALALAQHFVSDVATVSGARVDIEEYGWRRIEAAAGPHDHSFVRAGEEVRTTSVTIDAEQVSVVSGLKDLVVLKSTGSEFAGFRTDDYTTLAETHDRVLATSLVARWTYLSADVDWAACYADVRSTLLARFADVHSLALQQTLYEMGKAVLERQPQLAEIRLSAPNIHHFVVDLAPFGQDNAGEVFHVADRPYGLIEATVQRDDAPPGGTPWSF